MVRFLAGFLIAYLLLFVAGYIALELGSVPVATKAKSLPFEESLAEKALEVYLRGADKEESPIAADEINLIAGAKVYAQNCAICHGHLGAPPSPIARGLFPPPPELLKPESSAVGYPVGNIHRLIDGGIRLTGMPGFRDSLSATELWQVSLLLVSADRLPERAKDFLRQTGDQP
ncbi:MAG: cytochrome c [Bdellovibrionales bacterium]